MFRHAGKNCHVVSVSVSVSVCGKQNKNKNKSFKAGHRDRKKD